jgi:RES domain-containing protein
MKLWRISEFADLTGEGGLEYTGRWNRAGEAIVYCADHPSTSLLEVLVRLDASEVPASYQLLEIHCPDTLAIVEPTLQAGWEADETATQEIWSDFISKNHNVLMRVPSVVMPKAANLLINPAHPAAKNIHIARTWRYPFDSRLLT